MSLETKANALMEARPAMTFEQAIQEVIKAEAQKRDGQ